MRDRPDTVEGMRLLRRRRTGWTYPADGPFADARPLRIGTGDSWDHEHLDPDGHAAAVLAAMERLGDQLRIPGPDPDGWMLSVYGDDNPFDARWALDSDGRQLWWGAAPTLPRDAAAWLTARFDTGDQVVPASSGDAWQFSEAWQQDRYGTSIAPWVSYCAAPVDTTWRRVQHILYVLDRAFEDVCIEHGSVPYDGRDD